MITKTTDGRIRIQGEFDREIGVVMNSGEPSKAAVFIRRADLTEYLMPVLYQLANIASVCNDDVVREELRTLLVVEFPRV